MVCIDLRRHFSSTRRCERVSSSAALRPLDVDTDPGESATEDLKVRHLSDAVSIRDARPRTSGRYQATTSIPRRSARTTKRPAATGPRARSVTGRQVGQLADTPCRTPASTISSRSPRGHRLGSPRCTAERNRRRRPRCRTPRRGTGPTVGSAADHRAADLGDQRRLAPITPWGGGVARRLDHVGPANSKKQRHGQSGEDPVATHGADRRHRRRQSLATCAFANAATDGILRDHVAHFEDGSA